MLKKTIEFVDYDGNKRVEDFYFNLSEAELVDMETSTVGGLTQTIRKMISAQDQQAMLSLVKDLIRKAYGEKSPDGRRFVKSKEISDGFEQTEAYSNLFMELMSSADAMSNFIKSIIPQTLKERLDESDTDTNSDVKQLSVVPNEK